MKPDINIVVAYGQNKVIGSDEGLPWYLPADLEHFKNITTGNVVIMGRKTYETIPERFRPLPNRQNIVLSNKTGLELEGATVVGSLDEAIQKSKDREIFVIGGAKIYHLALPGANRMYVTEIDAEFEGDTHFPNVDWSEWQEISREDHNPDDKNPYNYSFVVYERID